jgi:cation diffusion facilitator family transporter
MEVRIVRQAAARRAAWVSVGVNIALATGTALLAWRIGSVAMLAQATHTGSDVLTSIVVLVGFQIASAPADREHPYGHGRAEGLAAVVIAMLLTLAGLELAREAGGRLLRPQPVGGGWLAAGFMALVAAAKEGLARYALGIGRRIESAAVIGDAWHHRADAMAALLAGVAVAGAGLGLLWLDGMLGLGIAGIILHTAYRLGRDAASSLLGRTPPAEMVRQIEDLARSVDGVREIHRVSVHEYGTQRVVSMHVLVDPGLRVGPAHLIAEQVEGEISRELATETTVHVEPDLPGQSLSPARRGSTSKV